MDKYIHQLIEGLIKKVENDVPEEGDFTIVYETFKNPDKNLYATDYMLKVVQPPEGIEGRDKDRVLEFVAYKLPSPIISSKIIEVGTKDVILNKLKDEKLFDRLKELTVILSDSLQDV